MRLALPPLPRALAARIAAIRTRLGQSQEGVAIIEFALAAPLLVATMLAGAELAYFASVKMQVSQIAIAVADNASRLGQTDNSAMAPSVDESQVDSILFGAMHEGKEIGLEKNGRIILSSLERNPSSGIPTFHWQRCKGDLKSRSSYGSKGYKGSVGNTGHRVSPTSNAAVMVAEIHYVYEPLLTSSLIGNSTIKQEAFMLVRDGRNYGSWRNDGLTGKRANTNCR